MQKIQNNLQTISLSRVTGDKPNIQKFTGFDLLATNNWQMKYLTPFSTASNDRKYLGVNPTEVVQKSLY